MSINGHAYVVIIGVPFRRVDEDRCEVAADWGKSLMLLRDSLEGRFGPILVAAPELPREGETIGSQQPVPLSASQDNIFFHSLGSAKWRMRQFWMHVRHVRAACEAAVKSATVVHAGLNNLYQPYSLMGFYAAQRLNKATVFVIDGDIVTRSADLVKHRSIPTRLKAKAYSLVVERLQRRAVRNADLALLKGDLLIARYSEYAKNSKKFYDTSYDLEDVISAESLERKCSTLSCRPLKVLSLGRLVNIKNTDHVVIAFDEACKRGLNAKLDIIGGGPERASLEALISSRGLWDSVRVLGVRPYDEALLREVSTYDLMVFASTAEETPRALFDAMAGGCALLCYDIPFAQEVIRSAKCGILAKRGSITSLADGLVSFGSNNDQLRAAAHAAREFAVTNTSGQWYARRAQWTVEAWSRRTAGNSRFGTR